MPSPFPGMDPYLEHPGRWPDVHHELISVIRELLNQQLNPHYFVRIEERVYVSDDGDSGRSVLIPDLRVARTPRSPEVRLPSSATVTASIEMELIDDEIHEARLEVLDREYRHVIAVIEIVSPTNKVWGSAGRDSYVKKRSEISASSAHFVEIDLLRAGTPLYAKEMLPPHDYLVHLSRANGQRRRHQFWPVSLQSTLPVIAIPLKPGGNDASLDLQAVLTTAYVRGAYQFDIDYTHDPVPVLSVEQTEWARKIIGNTQ